MIKGKSVLAVIPARGGSKRVSRKNIRALAGKPLIAWTIEEAKKSKYIDRLILSSEDKEIISVAEKWGCEVPFVRPRELAQDDTPGIEPVLHAIKILPGYDYIALLQPTSPLRSSYDIEQCIEMCVNQQAISCVSVTEVDKSPYWMYYINSKSILFPFLINIANQNKCRQKMPKVYVLNGAVYVAKTKWLIKKKTFIYDRTLAFIMPKERSIDIDNELDFSFTEFILSICE